MPIAKPMQMLPNATVFHHWDPTVSSCWCSHCVFFVFFIPNHISPFILYYVTSSSVLPHTPSPQFSHLLLRQEDRIYLPPPSGLGSHSKNMINTGSTLRDWSLITGRGGLQNGKIAGPKRFAPPPQDRVKLFAPPLLKSGNLTCPPYNMAKTSSYRVKSTPKLFVPPLQNGFVAPPLPVISDHSLIEHYD